MEKKASLIPWFCFGGDHLCGGLDTLCWPDIGCCTSLRGKQSWPSDDLYSNLYDRFRDAVFRDGFFCWKDKVAVEILERAHESRRSIDACYRDLALYGQND